MKISIKIIQKLLLKAINLTSSGLKSSSIKPESSNIHFMLNSNKATIEASDIASGISIPLEAEVLGEGDFWVNPTIFSEYIATLGGEEVTISTTSSEKITIEAGNSRATIPTVKIEGGDLVGNGPKEEGVVFKTSDFVNSVKWASTAVAIDESRPVLTGVLFRSDKNKSIRVVGSDGYRLSLSVLFFDEDVKLDFLVPYKPLAGYLKEWEGIGENLSILFDKEGSRIWIKGADRLFYVRLIQGDFPDFTKILSSEAVFRAEFDSSDFHRAIKQISLFARQASNIALCDFEKKKIYIHTSGGVGGNAEATVETKYSGEKLSLAFNYRYLLEYMKMVTGETVSLVCSGPLAPVQFIDISKKDLLHIIMPVRV